MNCIEAVFHCLSSLHDFNWYGGTLRYFYLVNTAPIVNLALITVAFWVFGFTPNIRKGV